MNVTTSLDKVKGVGAKVKEQLEAAGLFTVGDLITFLPRTYEDYSQVSRISDIQPGKVTVRARCEKIETRPVRRGLNVTTATLADDTGKIQAVWFNQPYRTAQLSGGDEFVFSGEFEFSYNRYQLTNPSAEKSAELPSEGNAVVPVYRAVAGLKTALVRKLLSELRPLMVMMPGHV